MEHGVGPLVDRDRAKPTRRLAFSLLVLVLAWLLLSAGGGVTGAELVLIVGAIVLVVLVRLTLQRLRKGRVPA